MNDSRLRPTVVLWWGIALSVIGTILVLILPNLAYAISSNRDSATGVDQGLLLVIDYAVRIINATVAPLGAVLIGASIVMTYLRSLLRPTLGAMVTGRTEATRPR